LHLQDLILRNVITKSLSACFGVDGAIFHEQTALPSERRRFSNETPREAEIMPSRCFKVKPHRLGGTRSDWVASVRPADERYGERGPLVRCHTRRV